MIEAGFKAADINNINVPAYRITKIPFIDTDDGGKRGIYQGVNTREPNQKKIKLPEGWMRGTGEEYNGLYYYYQKGGVPQWNHP